MIGSGSYNTVPFKATTPFLVSSYISLDDPPKIYLCNMVKNTEIYNPLAVLKAPSLHKSRVSLSSWAWSRFTENTTHIWSGNLCLLVGTRPNFKDNLPSQQVKKCQQLIAQYVLLIMLIYFSCRSNILGHKGEVAEEFGIIMKTLWSGQYKCISPRDFRGRIGKINETFGEYAQQDSQELLLFLMDGLHEDLNEVRSDCMLCVQDKDKLFAEICFREWR